MKNPKTLFRSIPLALSTLAALLGASFAHADDSKKGNPQPPAFVDRAGKAVENTVKKVGQGASKVGEKVGEGAKKVGAAVDRGADAAGKKVGVNTKGPDAPQKKAEPQNAGK